MEDSRTAQQKWNENNPEIIKQSRQKYDKTRPIWSFRPKHEIIEWLEEEQWEEESKAELLNRKLEKLMKLEQEGY